MVHCTERGCSRTSSGRVEPWKIIFTLKIQAQVSSIRIPKLLIAMAINGTPTPTTTTRSSQIGFEDAT